MAKKVACQTRHTDLHRGIQVAPDANRGSKGLSIFHGIVQSDAQKSIFIASVVSVENRSAAIIYDE